MQVASESCWRCFVAISANVEDQAADGIRGVDAVIEHGFPGGIALDDLVLAEGFEQIGEGLLRNIFGKNCFAESDEDGMRGAAVVAGVEFALPPVEQLEGAGGFGNFVAEIVGPAAIGVDVVEMLVQLGGEQPGSYVEIFVVVGGEPAGVLLRFFHGAARGGGAFGDFKFVGGATSGE